jgi:glycosyltransferase involved in cell wall biosynthesis
MVSRAWRERIFGFVLVRWLLGLAFVCRGALRRLIGNEYRGLDDWCWVARVSNVWPWQPLARRVVLRAADRLRTGPNTVVKSYLASSESTACASLFTITGSGPHDLLRDLIVLKSAAPGERGVVLLKYVRTFDAVIALFDLPRLMDRYYFVLEPCWAGYWDPSILMYVTPNQPVFVQCFTPDDLAFVKRIGRPLIPVALGPADWVNADLFRPPDAVVKTHDLVMVANWAPHKRHAQLFAALESIRDRDLRVLLVGFAWGGRTAADIRREAAAIRNPRITVDVLESVPPAELARHVSACRAFVFLSRKEGDNKALVEAMFTDVPAIVYDKTIGGAPSRINPATGVFSSDEDLPQTIRAVLDAPARFSPRAWALEHTGSAVATQVLDDLIRTVVRGTGGRYDGAIVEKTNAPNLAYKRPADRDRFAADYAFILGCRPGQAAR